MLKHSDSLITNLGKKVPSCPISLPSDSPALQIWQIGVSADGLSLSLQAMSKVALLRGIVCVIAATNVA